MISLDLKSGGSISVATVPKGTSLGAQVQSQMMSSGREVSVCVRVRVDFSFQLLMNLNKVFITVSWYLTHYE